MPAFPAEFLNHASNAAGFVDIAPTVLKAFIIRYMVLGVFDRDVFHGSVSYR